VESGELEDGFIDLSVEKKKKKKKDLLASFILFFLRYKSTTCRIS
jgi:hypothetical protein